MTAMLHLLLAIGACCFVLTVGQQGLGASSGVVVAAPGGDATAGRTRETAGIGLTRAASAAAVEAMAAGDAPAAESIEAAAGEAATGEAAAREDYTGEAPTSEVAASAAAAVEGAAGEPQVSADAGEGVAATGGEAPSEVPAVAAPEPAGVALSPSNEQDLEAMAVLEAAAMSGAAAASFSEDEALEFAYLARAAFCTDISAAWDCGPCRHVPEVESARMADDFELSTHGYVGRLRGQCVVAFRGTDYRAAWVQNLKSIGLRDMHGCSFNGRTCGVGSGFLEDWWSLAPAIKSNLESIGCSRDTPLIVTGHSLGGALAIVAMLDLKLAGYNVAKGYTFGQPRVGDATFAAAFTQAMGKVPVLRVTQSGDPVPLLPPPGLFQHIGQEMYNEGWSRYYRACQGSEDMSCSRGQSLFWLLVRAAINPVRHIAYLPPQFPLEAHCDVYSSPFFP